MTATQILNMNGGTGNQSYAKNSPIQRKAISIAKPMIEEAIEEVYCKLLPKTLHISDLGCASGPNTFYISSLVLETVDHIRRNLGRESPEFLIYLNDLPTNDFNTIFKASPKFKEDLKERLGSEFGPCFLTGVPGSFFNRLFPVESLHFVHSSYSLHWLSNAPEGAEGNKGNIYISSTSPSNVAKAYLQQFTKDFSSFLRFRAKELVAGGGMVLTIVGRRPEEECWGPLNKTLNDMVNEGLIEEEKLESFNLPVYNPTVQELKSVIEMESSFTIRRVELVDIYLNEDGPELSTPESFKSAGVTIAQGLRATLESMLVTHFGKDIMDELFKRYAETISVTISKGEAKCCNVTLSLKKGD